MTQLTARECIICGMAIGKCNVISEVINYGPGFWVDATLEEMQELVKKLEQIENESKGSGSGDERFTRSGQRYETK